MTIKDLRLMKEASGIEENLWDQVLSHFQAMSEGERLVAIAHLEARLRTNLDLEGPQIKVA